MPTQILRRLAAGAAVFAASASPALAQVTVGTAEGGSAYCIPLGCTNGDPSRFQQVYDAAAFAGPMDIGALTFYHTQAPGATLFAPVTLDLWFSTTPLGPGALTTVFDDNVGTGAQRFATLTLSGNASAAAPSFTITGSAFHYDPAQGHLLLDWRITIDTPGFRPWFENTFFDADYGGTATSAVVDAEWVPGAREVAVQPEALVTTFSPAVSAVPEPGTSSLLGLGLFGLAMRTARRRRPSR